MALKVQRKKRRAVLAALDHPDRRATESLYPPFGTPFPATTSKFVTLRQTGIAD